jgi:hypothetical protein
MSRSLDREEEKPREDSGTVDGLSRSGGETRPRAVPNPEPQTDFSENRRERILFRDREYRIRPSEAKVLQDLGTFRVIRNDDLVRGIYGGNTDLAQSDFRSLRRQGLIRSITFKGVDGAAARVHTLTGKGYQFAESRRDGPQFYYWGIVKPAEVEHDALLYRAFLRERARIHGQGGTVKQVILDAALKRAHYARTNRPGGSTREVQAQSAAELHLHVVDGHVMFPDFRVEYENEQGDLGRVDVEVATGNYRESHLAAKAAAGFRVYAGQSSGGGVRVQSGGALKGQIFPQQTRSVFSL